MTPRIMLNNKTEPPKSPQCLSWTLPGSKGPEGFKVRGNGSGAIRDIRKVPAASMNGATPTYLATPSVFPQLIFTEAAKIKILVGAGK